MKLYEISGGIRREIGHYPRASYKNHLQIVTGQKYRQGRILEEYYQIMGKSSVTGFVTGLVFDAVYIFDEFGYESYRVTKMSKNFEKILFQRYFHGRTKRILIP